uniref:Uncharacterized protein n=1 Tax=Arion vulgaris TaxID=1028688 RepID=A0A0B7BX16_9EUPU
METEGRDIFVARTYAHQDAQHTHTYAYQDVQYTQTGTYEYQDVQDIFSFPPETGVTGAIK